jgi:hypothetical protein
LLETSFVEVVRKYLNSSFEVCYLLFFLVRTSSYDILFIQKFFADFTISEKYPIDILVQTKSPCSAMFGADPRIGLLKSYIPSEVIKSL